MTSSRSKTNKLEIDLGTAEDPTQYDINKLVNKYYYKMTSDPCGKNGGGNGGSKEDLIQKLFEKPVFPADSPQQELATFICEECDLVFPMQEQFASHITTMHSTPTPTTASSAAAVSKSPRIIHGQNPTTVLLPVITKEEINNLAKYSKSTYSRTIKTTTDNSKIKDEPTTSIDDSNLPFKCSSCELRFPNKARRREHLKSIHQIVQVFYCKSCEKHLDSKSELFDHAREKHSQNLVECEFCEQVFTKENLLLTHVKTVHPHHKENGLPNEQNQILQDSETLKSPSSEHNVGTEVKLEITDVEKMETDYHPPPPPPAYLGIMYDCGSCDLKFASKVERKEHLKAAHNIVQAFLCNLCNLKLESKAELVAHAKETHDKKLIECEFCEQVYTNMPLLKAHVKLSHTESIDAEDTYECETCEKRFHDHHHDDDDKNKSPLVVVEQQPTVEAAYVCGSCQMKFKSKAERRNHLKQAHNIVQVFCCMSCSIQINSKSELFSHAKQKHGQNLFECEFCDRLFAKNFSLRRHVAAVHTGEKRNCEDCGMSFHDTRLLNSHKNLVHNVKKEI